MAAQEEDQAVSGEGELIVNTDLRYPICIGDDTLPAITSFLEHRRQAFVVLCDAQRDVLHLARQIGGLPRGLGVIAVELGESRKRFSTVERVHEELLKAGVDRGTLIVGVGGGVASDLFGFAAACYMRGVPYMHVATSLVAMVDASIGGKTGVDLKSGKNIAGTFTDPVAVFAHVDALQTLPFRHIREGLAEVVKAAVIEGHELFESVETLAPHPFWRWPWMELIAGAVKVKTMIVVDDREEAGMRELLNLGHTFGHALEAASGYRVSHGVGVALGLRAAGLLGLKLRGYPEEDHLRVLATMALLGMPLRTKIDAADVYAAMQSDKKKRDGTLRFVVPRGVGDVEYGVTAPASTVQQVLKHLQRSPEKFG